MATSSYLSPRWMAGVLGSFGTVDVLPFDAASVWFGQNVSQESRFGRLTWELVERVESDYPWVAACGGCHPMVVLRRQAGRT